MIKTIYIIILSYFVLGALAFYFINRHKEPEVAKASYTKFASYFVIINLLFFSIVVDSTYFRYLTLLIVGVGCIELIRLFVKSRYQQKGFFFTSVIIYALLAVGLYQFSGISKEEILFAFLILSIFDSFSQITGQLWGATKIMPTISPNKTLGGVVGGGLIAFGSAFLLKPLVPYNMVHLIILTIGLLFFSFWGDLGASFYKRKYHVKDYNNLIPGHGGFLDRFDSLIAGGAWVIIYINLFIL
nr:phosphatidate cytidylyltransferase [uncultured Carboxylicivirga sp.]